MNQNIPFVSGNDIDRIVKRDFPENQFEVVMEILKNYTSETENGRFRVYASILKLSGGNMELVEKYVHESNKDFRTVISLSEYPSYSAHLFEMDLYEEREEELMKNDWIQYKTWLEKNE